MKKLICLVIVLAIAILMALTVPEKKEHKQAMMKAISEYVDEEATNKGIADNGITRVGKKMVVKVIESVLSSKLEETNYVLFNTTHIKMEDKDKMLSVGMFGHVFTFNKDMLRDALDEAALEKAEKKREKKEAKAELKRLKEEAKAEKRRLKEKAKMERKELREKTKMERKQQRELKKQQRKAEKEMKKQLKDANK